MTVLSNQEPSSLALLYLKENKGFPNEYQRRLAQGHIQGSAFLNALSFDQRSIMSEYMQSKLLITNDVLDLEALIYILLDG